MEPSAVDLKAIIGLVRRRYLIVAGSIVLAFGIALVALMLLLPSYAATALVMVEPGGKDLLKPGQESASNSDTLRVDSEVELVKAEATLVAVAKELDLASGPEFAAQSSWRDGLGALFRFASPGPASPEAVERQVVDRLRGAIDVQRKGATFLIAITAHAGRPELAAEIANAVARTYIGDQLAAKVRATMEARDIIGASLDRAGSDIAQSEGAFDAFVDQNVQRISEATGRADLQQLRLELSGIMQARAVDAAAVAATEASLGREDWTGLAALVSDSSVAALERDRADTSDLLAGASGTAQAASLRTRLDEIEAEIRRHVAEELDTKRNALVTQQARITELRGRLRSAIFEGDLPADVLTGLYAQQQAAEVARQQYQTLLSRKNELDTQAILQVADSRLVSDAIAQSAPSFPSPRLFFVGAGVGGVLLGVVLALLVEYFIGGITSLSQAEAVLRVPALAALPRQRSARRGTTDTQNAADLLVTAPLSAFSESVRRLRIGVDQAMRQHEAGGGMKRGRVVVVASAAPGEGRTTVALALARAYALSGVSTLLIDCDLRKPSVHKLLGMESSGGLLDYLAASGDPADLKSIITVDGGSGARVIFGAKRSNIVTDQLIAGATFGRLIDAARDSFDVIILDTPPIGAVVDGLYLAGIADAVACVVKWSGTPQHDVRAAVAALSAARRPTTPIVAVINQEDSSHATRRGKYADYYAQA
jgi:polysaccharide biosynthesis transport protein